MNDNINPKFGELFHERLAAMHAAYQRPEGFEPIVVKFGDDFGRHGALIAVLRGYRFTDGKTLCKYQKEEDEQAAYNHARAAMENPDDGPKWDWIIIAPGIQDKCDPLGQNGYIGARPRKVAP